MNTQLLDDKEIKIPDKSSLGGLLQVGEEVFGYNIITKLKTDSSEAEIYLCSKDNCEYILKYYYTCKPKKDVIEKLKQFSHPDIISLYEYGEYKSHFYSVLQYAKGGSLDERDENGKYKYLPVSEEKAVQIVKEVINAFSEIHKKGIIHKDIKPGNLFYKNEDGSDILVGDFGISSVFDVEDGMSKHLTQTTAGTVGYSAPEVYSGLIGPELDYYSLGITLWVLLTAKEPFLNEKGNAMYPAQIMLDTIQGKIADHLLLQKDINISRRMDTLIRGLLTVNHDKRWNFDLITRFFNGEDIPVYKEERVLPKVEINEKVCSSFLEISSALIKNKEKGKNFIYSGKLTRYLAKIDTNFATKISDALDDYSSKKEEEKGLFYVCYSLCPSLDFKINSKISVNSIKDIHKVLETNPDLMLPFLENDDKHFYTYLNCIGFEDIGNKIKEIVDNTENLSLVTSRIKVALDGNEIKPFTDGKNDSITLKTIAQLENLSHSLKKRVLYFIKAGHKDLCAWIENVTGRNISYWRRSYDCDVFTKRCKKFGEERYLNLFLNKHYVPCLTKFSENYKCGLKDIKGDVVLEAAFDDVKEECCENFFIVSKENKWGLINENGDELIKLSYDNIDLLSEEDDLYICTKNDKKSILSADETMLLNSINSCEIYIKDKSSLLYIIDNNSVYSFNKDDKSFYKEKEYVKCYIITKDEREVLLAEKEDGYYFSDLEKEDKVKIKALSEPNVQFCGVLENSYILLKNCDTDRYSLYDSSCKQILKSLYNDIYIFNNYAVIRQKNHEGLYSLKNKCVIEGTIWEKCLLFKDFVVFIGVKDILLYKLSAGKAILRGRFNYSSQSCCYSLVDKDDNELITFDYCADFEEDFKEDTENAKGLSICKDGNFYYLDPLSLSLFPRVKACSNEGKCLLNKCAFDKLIAIIDNKVKNKELSELNILVDVLESGSKDYKGEYSEDLLELRIKALSSLRNFNTNGLIHSFDYYMILLAKSYVTLSKFSNPVENKRKAMERIEFVVTRLGNKDIDNLVLACDICIMNEKYEEAITYIDKAICYNPKNEWYYNRKGKCLRELGEYEKAISIFSLAIDINPNKVLFRERGKTYEALSKEGAPELIKKADDDYRRANI